MNRDQLDALMASLEAAGVLGVAGVRAALAMTLFRDGLSSPPDPTLGFRGHLHRRC